MSAYENHFNLLFLFGFQIFGTIFYVSEFFSVHMNCKLGIISGMIRRLCGKARQGKLAEYVCGDWGGRRVLMTGRPTTAFCHHNFNSTTAAAMCTAHLILWEYFMFLNVFFCSWGHVLLSFLWTMLAFPLRTVYSMCLMWLQWFCALSHADKLLSLIEAFSEGDAISFEIQNESESTGLLLLVVQRGWCYKSSI